MNTMVRHYHFFTFYNSIHDENGKPSRSLYIGTWTADDDDFGPYVKTCTLDKKTIASPCWIPNKLIWYEHSCEWQILGCFGSVNWIGPIFGVFSRMKDLDENWESSFILVTSWVGHCLPWGSVPHMTMDD